MSFKSSEDQKKGLHRNLVLYSAGIRDLFVFFFCLIIQTLTLNRERWNLDGGTQIFGGGTRPPYNLSTAHNQRCVESYAYQITIFDLGEQFFARKPKITFLRSFYYWLNPSNFFTYDWA